jgi:surface protein
MPCRVYREKLTVWSIIAHAQFIGAESFNQDLGNWNVSVVGDMSFMVRTDQLHRML